MANSTLQEAYSLDTSKTFDEQFSKVSLEAIFTYVFAVSIWALESLMDQHQKDINAAITANAVCSIPWYHAQALAFQLGHSVEYNPETYRFEYPVIDEASRIIRYAAVRQLEVQGVTKLRIHASKAGKQALSSAELAAFSAYIRETGAVGIHYDIISQAPSQMSFTLQVTRDAMVIDQDGKRLNGNGKPVEEAISNYLSDGIIYGSVFNRTKLIDAIQAADGVKDVVIVQVRVGSDIDNGQNIESPSGAFTFNSTNSVITYMV
ncbi:hypothetical protein SDC9_143153 [bioreactor metagenome]|uniref:Baseplate protein J-like domain-containing protein n=1 Tax=bioreactor metagenome TaxID=1076179 RepID=A0A645E2S0_9ZZZZ